jgi:hypothetical protein
MVFAAASGVPVAIWRMNSGMSIAGRTGRHAGRVMAEIAAVGGHPRLVRVERRLVIGEIAVIGGGGQTPATTPGVSGLLDKVEPPIGFAFMDQGCHRSTFFIKR